ncbi:DNA/RNA non-specific endonuclease [Paenibacillus herberti]|uniref:DNA/RNA non-specific endonuclease n=1 Tax=Paenibacillus herberti TaxID=1619309 RepID=UPI001FE7F6C6|nr:DNA/RNA non-specific endonuclease [Paenibacillus herberti]
MSGANVKMDLADVERLRQRFTAIGQDAMRLMQQVNGAAWEWEQIPTVREAGRAVRVAKELTAEAEELADFARRMMRGVERLQNENRLKMNLTFTVGKTWNPFGFGAYKQPIIGYGQVSLRMQQAAKMGISSVRPMPLMDAFQQDPVILGLKRIAASPNMTPEDRAAARSELERILKLREDIGKAQTAYGMYKAYGNRVLMDAMHEMAVAARQELKSKGIREGLYAENVDLSPYFQKPAIEACDFDPSYTGQPVPLGDDPKYRLLLSLGAQEGKVRDWARGELAKVQDSAQWRVAAGVVREGIAGQLDRYNATIPAEKIREMQEYLKKMNLYQGKVTGVYDEGLMASVAAYQTLANTVNTKWMVWNGGKLKPFEINGGFNEDLLRLARSDAAQGMRNNPNLKLNNGMLMMALTYSSVTDGIISQLQDEGMALLGVLNPKTYSDFMDVGEAILNGELTLEQIGDTLGESVKEEFVKPFQDVNRLYARVLSGKASLEESKEFGRALTQSALAFTAVKGAVKAGIEGGKELAGRLPDLKLDLKPVAVTPDGTWMRIGDNGIGGVQPLKPTSVQENYLKFMAEVTGKGLKEYVGNAFDAAGKLKPDVKYKAGEHQYDYETDHLGRIEKFSADDLKLTARDDRLPHDPKTPGKESGDHAGHLAGDRFGGSPELDNLVSQSSNINLSQYKKIENEWAKALNTKPPKHVSVDVKVNYDGDSLRPSGFKVTYEIDGKITVRNLTN